MSLKLIPTSWRDSMRIDPFHKFNFYVNPRGRVIPALTSAGVSYVKNTKDVNMRGTWRMQCGGSTDLTYLYTLSQRFIIEGWFRPEFAYDVANDQLIFGSEDTAECQFIYNATSDKIQFITSPGADAETAAFTTSDTLQKWCYIRAYFDNTAKQKGCYLLVNGVAAIDEETTPGAGTFLPLNKVYFFNTVAAESSYWVIHELDETLATGEYKTYQADRQIAFDFNGTTLARERIYIPRVNTATDNRGVRSFSLSKSVENPMTGSAGANTASMELNNIQGEWSDDQYDAFDPFQGYYNGTEKYLQNRVGVEIESQSEETYNPRDGLLAHWSADAFTCPEYPDGASPTYLQGTLVTDTWSGWATMGADTVVSVASGNLVLTAGAAPTTFVRANKALAVSSKAIRIKWTCAQSDLTTLEIGTSGAGTHVTMSIAGLTSGTVDLLTGANFTDIELILNSTGNNSNPATVDWLYVGTGECATKLADDSGNGLECTVFGGQSVAGISGNGISRNGVNAYERSTAVLASVPDVWWYHESIVNGNVQSSLSQTFINYKAHSTTVGHFWLVRPFNTDSLYFTYTTGSIIAGYGFPSFFTGYSATRIDIDVSVNWTTGVVNSYRNGVYFGTATMTTPVKPTAGSYLYFGSYQGTQYIASGVFDERRLYSRAPVSAAECAYLYANPTDWGALSEVEPLFIGRTTPGAFKRQSPNAMFGTVSIDAEDGIAELGETKLSRSYSFDAHDICDPAAETDSLVHDIARLVTKKEIRNYALNSSIENATIANSWTNSSMATFERSDTYAQFGTYSMKCIADAAGDKVTQVVKFETDDLIDVGDIFNLSAYIWQGTASTMKIIIEELTSAGALVGTGTEASCGATTDIFERVDVARTILAATCTQLRITFYALDAGTFYIDGVMLTRGIDPIDYFINNTNDGASGVGSAESYGSATYDTVAFDADAVDLEHPYVLMEQGSTAWEALKEIGDASIASYVGMTPDGVFRFSARYAETDPTNNGLVENMGGIATSLDVNTCNAVKVHGVIVKKETGMTALWNGEAAGIFTTEAHSKKLAHAIADGEYMSVSGSTTIEAKYSEDI